MSTNSTYLSPNGQQVTQGDGPVLELMVGTTEGVLTLSRAKVGMPWIISARSLTHCHIGQLLFEKKTGKLFAGAHADGGMWVSDDGKGKNWRSVNKGLSRKHIYALASRRINEDVTMFAGTSPAGLYRSNDLGENWEEVSSIFEVPDTEKWTFPPPPHIPHVKQIVFHPADPLTIYVLIEQGAFLKSVDDGKTWTDLTSYSHPEDESYRDMHRLVIQPNTPKNFYIATGVGMYRSADGGQTFKRLTRRGERLGYPDFVFLHPKDFQTIYVGGSELNPGKWYETGMAKSCVMRSSDAGNSWEELKNGMPEPMKGAIEAMTQHYWDGGMNLFVGTATGEVYLSEDEGFSWVCIANEIKPISKDDHHIPFISEEKRKEEMDRRHRAMAKN